MMDIAGIIRQKVRENGICNVIIAGGTCSGKTTFADNLKIELSKEFSVTVIKQDDYYKDIQDVPRIRKGYLLDSPNAFHTREFRQDIEQLLTEGASVVPQYDVAQNKRVSKNVKMSRSQVNILEGLHAIMLLEGLPDTLTVYIDTPLEVCLERRVSRDTGLYGVAAELVKENFADCITPMYHSYIDPQREKAEIIADGETFGDRGIEWNSKKYMTNL